MIAWIIKLTDKYNMHPSLAKQLHSNQNMLFIFCTWLQDTFTNIFGLLQGSLHQNTRFTENLVKPSLPPFHLRRFTHTVYGQGASVRPNRPCSGGGGTPSGSLNSKACNKLVTIRNSSIFASCSPMHTLRPEGYTALIIRAWCADNSNL